MKLLQRIHSLDVSTFYWCMARKHRHLISQMSRSISKTGDGQLYVILPLLAAAVGFISLNFLFAIIIAFACERALYFVLKNTLKRNRPQQALDNFTSLITPSYQFSFPSGHSSAAFMFASFAAVLLPAFAVPFYLWAASVALSRLFLGVHFPTDLAVGATMGSSIALLTLNFLI